MSSKFYLSKWKTYFFQYIDKFLKIEEVEYLIHYVKFEMCLTLICKLPLFFQAFLNVVVRLYIISPNLHRG